MFRKNLTILHWNVSGIPETSCLYNSSHCVLLLFTLIVTNITIQKVFYTKKSLHPNGWQYECLIISLYFVGIKCDLKTIKYCQKLNV